MDTCLTFQNLLAYKWITFQVQKTPKTIQIHAFFHFLENQAISAKLRNIAFLSLSKNNDEIWCQTCFMITNKHVTNLKSTCTKLKIRNHFAFFKLVQTAIAIETGVWCDSLKF